MFRTNRLLLATLLVVAAACGGDEHANTLESTTSRSEALVSGDARSAAIKTLTNADEVLAGFRRTCGDASKLPLQAGSTAAAADAAPPAVAADAGGAVVPTAGRPIVAVSAVDHFDSRGGRIQPALRADAGNEVACSEVSFPTRAVGAIEVTDAKSSTKIQVKLAGVRDVEGQTADGYLVYADAFPDGAHALLRATKAGVEDYVAFSKAPALEQASYEVTLHQGVAGIRVIGTSVEFLDASGAPRVRMARPALTDATCNVVVPDVAVAGCAYDSSSAPPWGRPVTPPGSTTCSIKLTWAGKNVAYPAVLDPAWTSAASMGYPRQLHAVIAVSGDRVLAAGGLGDLTP